MVTKSTNSHKFINYLINLVRLLLISVTLEAILREMHYEGWICRSITKVFEPTHGCEILCFNNIRFEIYIIIQNAG